MLHAYLLMIETDILLPAHGVSGDGRDMPPALLLGQHNRVYRDFAMFRASYFTLIAASNEAASEGSN